MRLSIRPAVALVFCMFVCYPISLLLYVFTGSAKRGLSPSSTEDIAQMDGGSISSFLSQYSDPFDGDSQQSPLSPSSIFAPQPFFSDGDHLSQMQGGLAFDLVHCHFHSNLKVKVIKYEEMVISRNLSNTQTSYLT